MSRANRIRSVALALILSTLWCAHAADAPKAEAAFGPGTVAAATHALSQPFGLDDASLIGPTIEEIFTRLGKHHNLTIRLDPEAIRLSKANGYPHPYEIKVELRMLKGLTLKDVLDDICSQLVMDGQHIGYTVRAGQIVVGWSFQAPSVPGGYKRDSGAQLFLTEADIARILYGPTVNLAVQDKSLAEIVALLREQTGVNIVIDPKVADAAKQPLTLTLSDAKLMSVLKVAGQMCELAPAVVDNIFYITTPDKAAEMMEKTEWNLGLSGK